MQWILSGKVKFKPNSNTLNNVNLKLRPILLDTFSIPIWALLIGYLHLTFLGPSHERLKVSFLHWITKCYAQHTKDKKDLFTDLTIIYKYKLTIKQYYLSFFPILKKDLKEKSSVAMQSCKKK